MGLVAREGLYVFFKYNNITFLSSCKIMEIELHENVCRRVQDDVVMGTLTVRENLMFSANLRLPQSMKDEEKLDRVDEAIDDLGLDKCADSKVRRIP